MLKKTKLQECWIWPQAVTDLAKSRMRGYTLNCPAGMSKLGDVRADKDPQAEGVIKADMEALPWGENTFDTVISDPPWKIGYYKRMRPFFEAVRVCKVGGLIIYNATWIPESKVVKLLEVFVRQDGPFTNASVISVFEKTANVSQTNARLLNKNGESYNQGEND